MPNAFQYLLIPFAFIFKGITSLRNYLYDKGIRRHIRFDIPVICIGNISVGGTGKTPHCIWLLDLLLANGYKPALLSRGYGRKTSGYLSASDTATPSTIGDEPFQIYNHFSSLVPVVVSESRVLGIPKLLSDFSDVDVIVMDDGYQHRAVTASFNLLLTTASKPFTEDYLLPTGRLRESREGANRANAIIITKAEEIDKIKLNNIKKDILAYSDSEKLTGIFTSETVYAKLENNEKLLLANLVAVCGLANNIPFLEYVQNQFNVVKTFAFADHHHYSKADEINILAAVMKNNASIICPEKDFMKLKELLQNKDIAIYPLPITVKIAGADILEKIILKHLKTF